jgi:hypothetical protein
MLLKMEIKGLSKVIHASLNALFQTTFAQIGERKASPLGTPSWGEGTLDRGVSIATTFCHPSVSALNLAVYVTEPYEFGSQKKGLVLHHQEVRVSKVLRPIYLIGRRTL